jgi:hypothetical protein
MMEEARKVLERLERIERLGREEAPAAAILVEMRQLVAEAEAWTRVEAASGERAGAAVEGLRDALERADEAALPAERTLVA